MSGDVVARAKAALAGVTDGPWLASKQRESRPGPRMPQPYVYPGNIVSEATKQIVFTQTGNAANSQFIAAARSLVPELVAEVERLQRENLTLHESAVHWRGLWQQNTATASAAIAERDAANAEVEKLRGALETIREICEPRHVRTACAVMAVIERAGIEP